MEMIKTIKQRKAQKDFMYQCRRASKCRHDRYQISCNSCPQRHDCEIQDKINEHKSNM